MRSPGNAADAPPNWLPSSWTAAPEGDTFAAMSAVVVCHRRMTRAVDRTLRRLDLQLTDYVLLMTLTASPTGTRSISYLARELLVHATTASLAVGRLEARDLVSRSPDPGDRRTTLIAISPTGRELARRATTVLRAVNFGLSGTSRADRTELTALLGRLSKAREAVEK